MSDETNEQRDQRIAQRIHANRHRIAAWRAHFADVGINVPDEFLLKLVEIQPMDPRPRLIRSAEGEEP